ncbi:MAG: peptidoglycan DD-metalloendopeptidase family protein, partial [Acidobacteria bacterium]|nr:peptidoglycan DD-metalloendopeptidase family protein [Acidobacteriota bacterium]
VGLYAIDFAMPIGTSIIAARDGEVVAARGEFYDNNGEDLKENFVFIRHADGSIGRYFHLTRDGALVKIGDKIKQGQLIGLSGNTGQSAGPHLHFDVQQCGPNLPPNYNQMPCGQTVPLTFRNTTEYSCNLITGKTYKALDFISNNGNSTPEADKEAITKTALDYIEGWYEGNAERMERSLHPDLAKRIVRTNLQNGQSRLDQMSALSLVQGVKRGGGKQTPKEKQQKDVIILDVFENTASVKAVMSDWIDYMHLAKFNGRWVIVNVLWELKPKEK